MEVTLRKKIKLASVSDTITNNIDVGIKNVVYGKSSFLAPLTPLWRFRKTGKSKGNELESFLAVSIDFDEFSASYRHEKSLFEMEADSASIEGKRSTVTSLLYKANNI